MSLPVAFLALPVALSQICFQFARATDSLPVAVLHRDTGSNLFATGSVSTESFWTLPTGSDFGATGSALTFLRFC